MLEVRVDGFNEFARDLRRLEPLARKELFKNLRAVAVTLAATARSNAPYRSGNLRRAIRVRQRRGSPAVVVLSKDAPYARTIEYGRRHPLYGNRRYWYTQPRVPFLEDAVDSNRPAALVAVNRALTDALRRTGWDT